MHKLLKKSQFWYYDLMLGIFIFSVVLIMGFSFIKDSSLSEYKESESYVRSTHRVSELMLTEGLPSNWSIDEVFLPGLLTDGYLDVSKVDQLANMSVVDYERSKMLLGLDRNYYVSFQGLSGQVLNISSIGTEANFSEIEGNFITLTRYIAYKEGGYSKIIQMVVQTWD